MLAGQVGVKPVLPCHLSPSNLLLVSAEIVADQAAAFSSGDIGTVLVDVDEASADDWQGPGVSREEWSAAGNFLVAGRAEIQPEQMAKFSLAKKPSVDVQ